MKAPRHSNMACEACTTSLKKLNVKQQMLIVSFDHWMFPFLSGWWYTYPSEKYEFVSWDDEIPNIWKVIKFMFQTTNQLSILS